MSFAMSEQTLRDLLASIDGLYDGDTRSSVRDIAVDAFVLGYRKGSEDMSETLRATLSILHGRGRDE